MKDCQIYALKVGSDMYQNVYRDLKAGEARFGWSGCPTANLHELRKRVDSDGIESLSADEKSCYQEFLLEIDPGDYVIYVNVPKWGRCTLAKVTKPYYWDYRDGDFNHRLGVDPATVADFDRNDAIVHPTLSARLKLQGRWWRVYARTEFGELLESISAGKAGRRASEDDRLARLATEIGPLLTNIADRVQHTHPAKALESLLMKLLDGAQGVVNVESHGSGRADKGADVIATIETQHPLTGELTQEICLVQAKSFTGSHGDLGAVDDIRRAFDAYPEATQGLIVSTAKRVTPEFEEHLERLRDDTGKTVRLIVGPQLAAFVLRHGSSILIE